MIFEWSNSEPPQKSLSLPKGFAIHHLELIRDMWFVDLGLWSNNRILTVESMSLVNIFLYQSWEYIYIWVWVFSIPTLWNSSRIDIINIHTCCIHGGMTIDHLLDNKCCMHPWYSSNLTVQVGWWPAVLYKGYTVCTLAMLYSCGITNIDHAEHVDHARHVHMILNLIIPSHFLRAYRPRSRGALCVVRHVLH